MDAVLQRGPDWRVKNTCPACTYKLKDELPMRFSMLIAMDGNDSLKRIMSTKTLISDDDEGDTLQSRICRERKDSRDIGDEYFIAREEVDKWDINQSTNTVFDEEVFDRLQIVVLSPC